MFFALFGLGDRIGHGKSAVETKQGRAGSGMDANGEPIVCDPDGQFHSPAKGPKSIGDLR